MADFVYITDEQINSLVSGLLDGNIAPQSMDEQLYNQLVTVNDKLMSIASLVDSNDIEAFGTGHERQYSGTSETDKPACHSQGSQV